ncbi:MAG: hypothetical protein JSW54_09915, partial [Fidelibacterota bacterium]
MKRSWCRVFFRLFQLIIFAFASVSCNRTVPDPTVIAVNDSTVHLDEYLDQYAHFLRGTGLSDNLRSRHLFTDALIDEILFISWADSVRLLARAEHLRELQAIDDQLLLNRLYQVEIRDKLTVPV